MFSIDFPEIVIILGLALVVLGPKKLPVVAGKIGRWVGRARTMARQFREQLEQEISTAENAVDIRKSINSVDEPARKQPASGVPQEAVSHGTVGQQPAPHEPTPHEPTPHEPTPYEPTPYNSGPYEMPPAEGYGPPPQQLSFDEQLHDTALPPEAAGGGAGSGSHSADPREWMPETQTWMASAGWETPQPTGGESVAGPATQPPASTPRPTAPQRPPSNDRAPEPAAASPSSRTEAVEHNDR